MTFPTAYASEVIDYITGRAVAQTTPSTTYLAGCLADPGVGAALATLAEDSTAGYARQAVTWTAPAVPVDPTQGDDPVSTNSAQVMFGPFTATMTTPWTHIALVDASSGTVGKVRWVWALDAEFLAAVGESMTLPAGSIELGAQG